MVSHLKASDAQLVRLEAAVGWDPVSNAVRLHKALGFRPETFVHRKAPLRALAFDDADVGEDAGFTSLAVCHVLDDSAGMLFAHAKHSKKPAALLRARRAVPAGATFVSAPVESTGVSLEDDEPPPEPPARPAQPMDPIERARLRAARRLARKNATSEDESSPCSARAPPMPPVALEYGEADDDDDGFRIVEMASE
ncbi:hypothetical protein JL720_1114 [Aureococcus anophagefferens]|nr:hypothetical protein JL720_1114 [Aureococcus anophagefferens]